MRRSRPTADVPARARAAAVGERRGRARRAARRRRSLRERARAASAPALLLLADLQVDDGDLAGAAQSLDQLARRYPDADQAPLARFRAGLLAWNGDAVACRGAVRLAGRALPERRGGARGALLGGARPRARGTTRGGGVAMAQSGDGGAAHLLRRDERADGSARSTGSRRRVRTARRTSRRWTAWSSACARCSCSAWTSSRSSRSTRSPRAGSRSRRRRAPIAQALSAVGEPARALRLALRTIERGGDAPRVLYRYAYPGAARRCAAGVRTRGGPRSGARRGSDPSGVDLESATPSRPPARAG